MNESRSVKLSISRDLLKRAKRMAADRDTSVSALMAEALAQLVDRRRYLSARGSSALDLAGRSVGRFNRGPKDLSTNRTQLDGFGR